MDYYPGSAVHRQNRRNVDRRMGEQPSKRAEAICFVFDLLREESYESIRRTGLILTSILGVSESSQSQYRPFTYIGRPMST
jgi:hypothetical protein